MGPGHYAAAAAICSELSDGPAAGRPTLPLAARMNSLLPTPNSEEPILWLCQTNSWRRLLHRNCGPCQRNTTGAIIDIIDGAVRWLIFWCAALMRSLCGR